MVEGKTLITLFGKLGVVVPGYARAPLEARDLLQGQIYLRGRECRIRTPGRNSKTSVLSRQEPPKTGDLDSQGDCIFRQIAQQTMARISSRQLALPGRYLSPSSRVIRPEAISHIRAISGPMNLKVRRSSRARGGYSWPSSVS